MDVKTSLPTATSVIGAYDDDGHVKGLELYGVLWLTSLPLLLVLVFSLLHGALPN
ncbi:hypothetical protein glysoja_028483 [Glycine soja]|uniref:Uncharacterized protein n=1 Tax=Glycine soja TaxID=3848 RepID=A0A0B2NXG4_GLYSO|nr:hypothetical protein glysoja_028483 [Glycine soja]